MTALTGLLLALATASPQPHLDCSPPSGHVRPIAWSAVSNTAMSITGDTTFAPPRMTFANGKSVKVFFDGCGWIPTKTSVPHGSASIYTLWRVGSTQAPQLLNGNKLCSESPTYMAISSSPPPPTSSPNPIFVNFYNSKTPPTAWDDAALCASLTYELKQ